MRAGLNLGGELTHFTLCLFFGCLDSGKAFNYSSGHQNAATMGLPSLRVPKLPSWVAAPNPLVPAIVQRFGSPGPCPLGPSPDDVLQRIYGF